jgi:hypothetical protein
LYKILSLHDLRLNGYLSDIIIYITRPSLLYPIYCKKSELKNDHSLLFPERAVEASQIFLWNAYVLLKWFSYHAIAHHRLITVHLRFLGVSAVNRLVAFYNIHRRKGELKVFWFILDFTQDKTKERTRKRDGFVR